MLCRLRTNEKEENQHMNTEVKRGRGTNVIQSLLGVFRVGFFKKKADEEKKEEEKGPTRPDPNSKASIKRKLKTQKNRERRIKR